LIIELEDHTNMNFVSNIIWNSVEGFVEAGTRTAGGYAGDALLKAGDLIEGSGRSVGKGMFPSYFPTNLPQISFVPSYHKAIFTSTAVDE
jgi:hypothetical protein